MEQLRADWISRWWQGIVVNFLSVSIIISTVRQILPIFDAFLGHMVSNVLLSGFFEFGYGPMTFFDPCNENMCHVLRIRAWVFNLYWDNSLYLDMGHCHDRSL